MILLSEQDAEMLRDAVRRILALKGGPGVAVTNDANGITIALERTKLYNPTAVIPAAKIAIVIVKWSAGSDGSSSTFAAWTYDVYALADTGYVTKLNLSGAVNPKCSRARIAMCSVTKATDGSVGLAYYDTSGAIQIFDLQEVIAQNSCAGSAGIDGGGA